MKLTSPLKKALDALTPRNASPWLVQDKHGHRISDTTFGTAWERLWKRVEGVERFRFHDLKAMRVTAAAPEDRQLAGHHHSPRMVAIYDRAKPRVKAGNEGVEE